MNSGAGGWINLDVIPAFGSSLYQLLREQRVPAAPHTCVPTWLSRLCDYLSAELEADGAFWLGPRSLALMLQEQDVWTEIYSHLCEGRDVSWDRVGVAGAALFLRLVLERLPEPLMVLDLHDLFVGAACDTWGEPGDQISCLRRLIMALPMPHAQLLRKIIRLFSLVLPKDLSQLGEVWGPTLLLRPGVHPLEGTCQDAAALVFLFAQNATMLLSDHDEHCVAAVNFLNRLSDEKVAAHSEMSRGSEVPNWLTIRNERKLQSITRALAKLRTVSAFLRDLDSDHGLNLAEFLHVLSFLDVQLSFAEAHLNPAKLARVVDTFHLSRAYRYLCDLDETLHCTQELGLQDGGRGERRLLLYFTNERLKESLEKLRLALLYEVTLFCDAIKDFHRVFPPERDVAPFVLELIDHPTCQTLWRAEFGYDLYAVGWRYFCDVFCRVVEMPSLTHEQASRLGAVLDPCRSEFVTVYRFSELMKAFRQSNCRIALSTALRTLTQPYFHPYVARGAIAHLFEPHPVGTFLVRFSASSPGAFAFDYKKSDGLYATKIFTKHDRYVIVESAENTRTFESIEAVVDHYARVGLLLQPLTTRLTEASYFYGFLTMEETEWCLHGERSGTYLLRFSLTFRDQLTVSFVGAEGGLNSLRLERLANGKVSFMDQQFSSVHAALAAYAALFQHPYREIVSLQFEEDEQWRRSSIDRLSSLSARFFVPLRLASPSLPNSTPSSNSCVRYEPRSLELAMVPLYKLFLLSLNLINTGSAALEFAIAEPLLLNRRCFCSALKRKGELQAGETFKIEIAVVLYRPIVLEHQIEISLTQNGENSLLTVPLRVCAERRALGDDGGSFWTVLDSEFTLGESISGTVGNVNVANLYGAKVAIKRWDYGAAHQLPESFKHELAILRELQHDCLVTFIGGRSDKPGTSYIVTEYCVNNSLFVYLPLHPLTLLERSQLAHDAATGMHYVHAHHLVHRDLKSLNLLVDGRGRVKIADFGESRVVSHLMTPERGSYNWMAPEVLKTRTYTGKADVFSFGIILWEICTAQRPDRLMSDILAGVTFIFPKHWLKQLPEFVELAKLCWQLNPAKRPSFAVICQRLQSCRERLIIDGGKTVKVAHRRTSIRGNIMH